MSGPTPDEIYEDLDTALREAVEGYTLSEVLERMAVVVRALPRGEDHTCPGGAVFSEGVSRESIAAALEDLAI